MKHLSVTKTTFISLGLALLFLGVGCNQPAKDGGIFRTLDSGESWEQKNFVSRQGKKVVTLDDTHITKILIHPKDSNIIYIGTGDKGLYITLDAGERWYQTGLKSGSITNVVIDPVDPTIMYAARGTTVLKSIDEGQNWNVIYTDPNSAKIYTIVVDHSDNKKIYVGSSVGAVYKSIDGGENWDLRFKINGSILKIFTVAYDPNVLYLYTGGGSIYKTVNGAEPRDDAAEEDIERINSGWKKIAPTDELQEQLEGFTKVYRLELDPQDNHIMYATSERGLLRSTDGGDTWSDQPTLLGFKDERNTQIRHLTIDPQDSKIIYFFIGKIMHKTADNGESWQTINTFKSQRKITDFVIDPEATNVMYIGTQFIKKKGGLTPSK